MPTRYIGITDFTSATQVAAMQAVLDYRCGGTRQSPSPLLHVGVMMSYKTLNALPSSWSEVFVPKEQITDIFTEQDVMNCLHYADYKGLDVSFSLARALGYGGTGMNAVQLDMVWPQPRDVAAAVQQAGRTVGDDLEVILQINSAAMAACGDSPLRTADQLRGYEGLVTHVLLDKSMGRGQGMDAAALLPYVREIHARYPELGIAVAGGSGPNTWQLVIPLLEEFPFLSVDAHGQLRSNGDAHDPIEWDRAAAYVSRMAELFLEYQDTGI